MNRLPKKLVEFRALHPAAKVQRIMDVTSCHSCKGKCKCGHLGNLVWQHKLCNDWQQAFQDYKEMLMASSARPATAIEFCEKVEKQREALLKAGLYVQGKIEFND